MVRLEFVNDTIMTTEGVALSVCARILDSPSEFVVAILDAISDTANGKSLHGLATFYIYFSTKRSLLLMHLCCLYCML